jgi:hypothetical protein
MWRAYSWIIPTSASRSNIGPPPLPCTIEVTVTVGVGAEQPGHILARQHHPERRTLYLGQVSHQPQERHRRRFDGTPRHSLRIKT